MLGGEFGFVLGDELRDVRIGPRSNSCVAEMHAFELEGVFEIWRRKLAGAIMGCILSQREDKSHKCGSRDFAAALGCET